MKKAFAIAVVLLSAGYIHAQQPKTATAKLTQATVFFNGAELTHSASASLGRGENELTVENLSNSVNLSSLKIKSTGGVVISSYNFGVDYLSSAKTSAPAIKRLEDSVAMCRAAIDRNATDIKINTDMSTMLKAGVDKNVSGSQSGMTTDELAKALTYYKTRSGELYTEKNTLNKQRTDLQASLTRLQSQLAEESGKSSKTSGVLRLTLASPAAGACTFTISYFTDAAAWMPFYEINAASTDAPVVIAGKARVSQTTGLDWDKVKLSLSTSTPTGGRTAPLFNAWTLYPQQLRRMDAFKIASAGAQNSYSYKDEDIQLSEVVVVWNMKQDRSATPAPQPLVILDGRESSQDEIANIDPSMIKSTQVLKGSQAKSAYGSRGANGVIVVTLKSAMDDFVATSDNASGMTFDIDMPYSIPGNGKVQNIDLLRKEAPAEFKYYCAPKLDPDVYLLAEIANWEKLGLLSGPATVTYDGTYVGETTIDASSTAEKLTLTLGSDKRVAVKREKMRDFSATKTLGSDVLKTFVWQITVRNNSTRPIKMVLKDQYPISSQKNIEVTLDVKQTTPWTANKEELGVVTWEEDLAGGASKTYKLGYSVKYPKDMNLNL